jgi:type VI secretion system protein ImpK
MSDSNRTVFRPSPLQNLKNQGQPQQPAAGYPQGGQDFGQPQGYPQQGYAPPPAYAPSPRLPDDDIPAPPVGAQARNAMMAKAGPLLALLASVRAGRARTSLPDLHGKVSGMIAGFDQEMRGKYPEEHVRRANYALAATADDVALNLPDQGGDAAEWARRSMVVRFFGENIGGDRFWRLLEEMIARPAEFRDLLELYHGCMASGFEGRYRVMPDGKRAHQEMMQRAYVALEHPRQLSQTELSPHWKGQPTGLRKVGFWAPMAFAGAGAAALLLLAYIGFRVVLMQTGAPAMAALQAINPDEPLRLSRVAPAAPAPPAGQQSARLRTFLAPEIEQGLVTVIEDPSTVRVRTTVGQLFRSGSDQLDPERLPLFERIAKAIETEPGPVRVEGYTDSDRVSSVAFPDNVALSQARAETVAGLIRRHLTDAGRVSTEGYGDAQPIASNSTSEGKAQNRRVEVVIQRRG